MTPPKSDARWAEGTGIPEILNIGDPRLREIACSFAKVEELKPLCNNLVTLLQEIKGAGLAASQIGSKEKVIVLEVRKTDLFPNRPESPLYIMIDPTIVEKKGDELFDWEGCFSVPGLVAKVKRHSAVRVTYVNIAGEKKDEWIEGYLARVVQHEIDHLSGIIFNDKMDAATLSTVENWKKHSLHEGIL